MRQIADLPGPSGLPLLGNLLQVDRDRIHQDVERWAREHGPLFRFAFGDGGLRSGPRAGVVSVAAEGHAAPARTLAERSTQHAAARRSSCNQI